MFYFKNIDSLYFFEGSNFLYSKITIFIFWLGIHTYPPMFIHLWMNIKYILVSNIIEDERIPSHVLIAEQNGLGPLLRSTAW